MGILHFSNVTLPHLLDGYNVSVLLVSVAYNASRRYLGQRYTALRRKALLLCLWPPGTAHKSVGLGQRLITEHSSIVCHNVF